MRRLLAILLWSPVFYGIGRFIARSTIITVVGVQDPKLYPLNTAIRATLVLNEWRWAFVVGAISVANMVALLGWLPGTTRPIAHSIKSGGRRSGICVIALLIAFLLCVGFMHVVRSDLNPRRNFLSEYVLDDYGVVMVSGMVLAGLAAIALSIGLWRSVTTSFWLMLGCASSLLAGMCYIAAAIFKADKPSWDGVIVPATADGVIHDTTAVGAAYLATAVFAVLPPAFWHCPRWRPAVTSSVVAAVMVFALFVLSITLGYLPAGLGQRCWVMITAICAMGVSRRMCGNPRNG